jgi:hypothetical protein
VATEPANLARLIERSSRFLPLIRDHHLDYDARLMVANAVRKAEVVVIGDSEGEVEARLGLKIRTCGARIVEEATERTRFAIVGPLAETDELVEASERGIAVLAPDELLSMVAVHDSLTGLERLRAAGRRAREEHVQAARCERTARSQAPAAAPASAGRGERRNGGSNSFPAPAQRRLSDVELALQNHARTVRSVGSSSSFRTRDG